MQYHGEAIVPIVKIRPNFQVTIPNKVRQLVSLKVGDMLEAEVKDNKIVLSPKVVVDRDLEAALLEGLKDIAEGRVHGPFKTVREFKTAMKNLKKAPKS